MSRVPISSLPAGSRLWCFGASRPVRDEDAEILRREMEAFVEEWTAHGASLRAGVDLRDDRFLLVAVDEAHAGSSGCSRDALMRKLAEMEAALGIDLLDAAPVWFRDGDSAVQSVSRIEFRRLASEGAVGPDTTVFDLTADRLEALSAGRFERRASGSWHARLL